MKKTLISLLTALTLATSFAPIQAEAKASDLYAETFIVYEIDREEDIIFLMTYDGEHDYIYEGVEDWHAGDIASALMDSNGTSKVSDDVILSLKYSGNIY